MHGPRVQRHLLGYQLVDKKKFLQKRKFPLLSKRNCIFSVVVKWEMDLFWHVSYSLSSKKAVRRAFCSYIRVLGTL